ncbi:hypothetical protein [Vibrio rarus]|uniref:hypothetical protein n=1 Tax=Vibrio rarus TaxID=413403 RepID=UPI0021C28604|nr:hypothetical protein [Vibrio rarus]
MLRWIHLILLGFSTSVIANSNIEPQQNNAQMGMDTEQVKYLDKYCHQGAKYHERRIFDAISDSELINWSKVDLIDISSRLNYTRTLVEDNHPQVVSCDIVINYFYDDKDIIISSQYRVQTQSNKTLTSTNITSKAVNDFMVRVMVN